VKLASHSPIFGIDSPPTLHSQAKIVLKASSEEEILELEAIAKSLNLCARSIHDA
jgi:peptidyl-tRNA hydrolase